MVMIKFKIKEIFKKGIIVVLAVISLLGGGTQPLTAHANTCPGNNSGTSGRTCNENSQIRVELSWRRLHGLTPSASATVFTRTNQSRRIRVNLRWYNVRDTQRVTSLWWQDTRNIPQNSRLPTGASVTMPFLAGEHWDGRFRTSSQRMIHTATTWNTSAAGTVSQSRSWNMR